METVLIVIHLLIVLALCGTVLLQRSEGGGLGMGGSPSAFLTGRGQANLLTRLTAILGAAFFVTSLALAVMASRGSTKSASPLDTAAPPPPVTQNAPAPAAPGNPNVLDQLKQIQGGQQPK